MKEIVRGEIDVRQKCYITTGVFVVRGEKVSGYERASVRRRYKRCGRRDYRYVTFVTLRDNTGRRSRLVMELLRNICKRYSGRRWGRKVRTSRATHVHAIVVSEKRIDRDEVVEMCRPHGIRAWVEPLNGKPSSVLRERIRYIRSPHNSGREIGSEYVVKLAYRVLYFSKDRNV